MARPALLAAVHQDGPWRLQELPKSELLKLGPHDSPSYGRRYAVFHNQVRLGEIEIQPHWDYSTQNPRVMVHVELDWVRLLPAGSAPIGIGAVDLIRGKSPAETAVSPVHRRESLTNGAVVTDRAHRRHHAPCPARSSPVRPKSSPPPGRRRAQAVSGQASGK
jgi:hypothetical protein